MYRYHEIKMIADKDDEWAIALRGRQNLMNPSSITWYQVPGAAVVLVPGYRYWHDVHKRVYRYI